VFCQPPRATHPADHMLTGGDCLICGCSQEEGAEEFARYYVSGHAFRLCMNCRGQIEEIFGGERRAPRIPVYGYGYLP